MIIMTHGFREMVGVSCKGVGEVASPAVSPLQFGECLGASGKRSAGRGV